MGVLGSARVSRVGFGFSRKQAFSPLALVPLFFRLPLGILTHIYSLRNSAVYRMADGF